MPNSNSQTGKKTAKTRKTPAKKTTKTKKVSVGKKTDTFKKSPQSKSSKVGFKKNKITVRIINTPVLEESEKLKPVPEIVLEPEIIKKETLVKKEKTDKDSGIKNTNKNKSLVSEFLNNFFVKKTKKDKSVEKDLNLTSKTKASSEEKDEKIEKNKEKEAVENKIDLEKKENKKELKPLSFNLYRKIAFSFIILTIFLLLGVTYFSLPSLKISVTPEKSVVNDTMTVNVYDNGAELDQNLELGLNGILGRVRLDQEKIFPSTGARTVGREIEGTVTLINNYSQDQLLVRTTRLLSPEGKMYRIAERVNVPAGGSVEVEIYSDDPSPDMAIGPTKFTIPGLWAGLQSDIYAENEDSFEYRVKIDRYIQQSDIDRALEEIRKTLEDEIANRFKDSYEGQDRVLYRIDEGSVESLVDSEAGDEKDEFKVKVSALVNVIAFENQKIIEMATNKLVSITPGDKTLINFYDNKVSFAWDSFSLDNGIAVLKLSFSGEVASVQEKNILDKNKITNLNQEQLIYYLEDNPRIKDYQIKFFPSFIKKVPNLSDRINIEIKLD